MDKITLGTRNVSIEFPGVKALSNVDFEIHTGMIHAVQILITQEMFYIMEMWWN